jgi:hypothetical protein
MISTLQRVPAINRRRCGFSLEFILAAKQRCALNAAAGVCITACEV